MPGQKKPNASWLKIAATTCVVNTLLIQSVVFSLVLFNGFAMDYAGLFLIWVADPLVVTLLTMAAIYLGVLWFWPMKQKRSFHASSR